MLQRLTGMKPVLNKERVRLLSNCMHCLHSLCQTLTLFSDNQALGTLAKFMHLGDQQAMLAEGPSRLYSAWEIETPCLRELPLCFHMRHCSWLFLSCGIISEQDFSITGPGERLLLGLLSLQLECYFLDLKLGPSPAGLHK